MNMCLRDAHAETMNKTNVTQNALGQCEQTWLSRPQIIGCQKRETIDIF